MNMNMEKRREIWREKDREEIGLDMSKLKI